MEAQPLLGFEPHYLFFAAQPNHSTSFDPTIQLHLIPLYAVNNNFI
jgi:hypothetical protein